jgi:hypothetical protein
LPARDVLSDDVELIEGERPDAVVGRVNTGSSEEFAVEIPHTNVPDDPGLFKNLLEVSADEGSGQPAGRPKIRLVLVERIIEETLFVALRGQQAKGPGAAKRRGHFPREVDELAAVVGQEPWLIVPGIPGIGWRRRVDRVGIHAPR